METFEEIAKRKLKKARGEKLINAEELVDKINAEKDIDKFRKLENLIDIGFEKIFGIKRNDSKEKARIVQKWQKVRKFDL